MKTVICFGEALIDFLHTDEQQQGPLTLPGYRQYPGGAPANAAVAVARLGGRAKFAGQVGADAFGDFLEQALKAYQVDTSLLLRHASAPTALAFVMLDQHKERSFSFYRNNTADLLFDPERIKPDWFTDKPIVHFCSNCLTTEYAAEATQALVNKARAAGSSLSFDVNLRHNLWPDGQADKAQINDLVRQSDIVKFSREELNYLAGENTQQYLNDCLVGHCRLILVTDGGGPVRMITRAGERKITPPATEVVDTTAGGDAFIGGLLYRLSQSEIPLAEQGLAELEEAVRFASCCGAIAVSRPGAFTALADNAEAEALMMGEGQG
jgi:fructokinase